MERVSGEHAYFANALFKAMREKGLNQSKIAAALWGTHEVSIRGKPYTVARNRDRISNYLRGQGFPRRETLYKLAEILEINPEKLVPSVASPHTGPRTPASLRIFASADGRSSYAELKFDAVLPAKVALEIVRLLEENHYEIPQAA